MLHFATPLITALFRAALTLKKHLPFHRNPAPEEKDRKLALFMLNRSGYSQFSFTNDQLMYRCNMAIMIGIHQQQEKMNNLHQSLGLRAESLASVGPFLSKREAQTWQQNMQRKFTKSEIISFDAEEAAVSPWSWYGFTFEK